MNLLDGKIYDPAAAVSKATTSLLALTALDTTNLRLTVTVPPSGKIYWRIKGALHGATTYPQIILGILEGASVLAAVDTEVAAIKAKTDSLNFTVAGQLDVNLLYVNGVQVTGAGTAGNPWGPV